MVFPNCFLPFLAMAPHLVTSKIYITFSTKRGWQFASPAIVPYQYYWQLNYWQLTYFAPAAAAATAGAPTFTLICLGLASSRFGITSVKTPFW